MSQVLQFRLFLTVTALLFGDFRGGELYFYETPINMAQSNGPLVEINHVVPGSPSCF
jgi:hypothetical protein